VAFWAFPQDVNHVRAYANMTDSSASWRKAVAIISSDRLINMWQVGECLHGTVMSLNNTSTSDDDDDDK